MTSFTWESRLGSRMCLISWISNWLPQAKSGDSMKNVAAAADPEAYLASLRGWQRHSVESLRAAVQKNAKLEERIKWGHLVYLSNGPVLLIRAEESRVLFGFWRGKRLVSIEPRLKPSGKYEMATATLLKGESISATVVGKLVKSAVALNKSEGDPTKLNK